MLLQLENSLVRPRRQHYNKYDIERVLPSCILHEHFQVDGLKCTFLRHARLPASHCVLYLHTHHGSRVEGVLLANALLDKGFCLCLFDFRGYGQSEGEYVTIGIKESEQIGLLLSALRERYKQNSIVLWGRSMGAVASVLYLANGSNEATKNVAAVVLDSPFSSLKRLISEIVFKRTLIPSFVTKMLISFFEGGLADKGLNFQKLEIQPLVAGIKKPVVFVVSKEDQFVSCEHTNRLYEAWGGKKNLVFIQENHNESRSKTSMADVVNLLESYLPNQSIQIRSTRGIKSAVEPAMLSSALLQSSGGKTAQLPTRPIRLLNSATFGQSSSYKRLQPSFCRVDQ